MSVFETLSKPSTRKFEELNISETVSHLLSTKINGLNIISLYVKMHVTTNEVEDLVSNTNKAVIDLAE